MYLRSVQITTECGMLSGDYLNACYSLTSKAATAKGLIAGNFILRRQDGSVVYGLSEEEVRTLTSLSNKE
jgi:hypothetical protein